MKKAFIIAWIVGAISSAAAAGNVEFLIVSAEQVRELLEGTQKYMVIDARLHDEYREAHVPGAVNIAPEGMRAAHARLPKDKSTPIIFYCRGVG